MPSVPPRRSNRIAAVNTEGKAKRKPKEALAKKRAQRASPEVDAAKTRESSSQKKPRKRAKTDAVVECSDQRPGKRGKLQQITETPLDILLEVWIIPLCTSLFLTSTLSRFSRTWSLSISCT